MSELPYMPWYPSDFRADTQHLSLEERGAYRDLLDELWIRGGSLKFDERRIARMLSITPGKFRKIWSEIGEFFCLEGGEIRNNRVTEEIEKARKNVEKRIEVARNAAQKRWKKPQKNNDGTMPEAMPEQCQPKPKGLVSPLRDITITLPQDGALALEGLRAACVSEHTRTEVTKLTSCITGWRDGVFLVTGRYAAERFAQQLAPELRAVNVKLEVGADKSPEQPKFKTIEGGKS